MLGNREGRKKLFAQQEEVFFSELSEEIKEAEETNPDFRTILWSPLGLWEVSSGKISLGSLVLEAVL